MTEPAVKSRRRSSGSGSPPVPQRSSSPPTRKPPPVPSSGPSSSSPPSRKPPPVPSSGPSSSPPSRKPPPVPSSGPSSSPPSRKPPPVPARTGRPQLPPTGQQSDTPPGDVETDSVVGTRAQSSRERKYLTGESGQVTGTSDEGKSEAIAGLYGSRTANTVRTDGVTTTETSSELEGLAGAQAAARYLSVHSDEEISATVEVMARAGLFGKAKGKAAVKRGAMEASVEGEASGGMGVQVEGNAGVKIDRSELIPAIEAVVHFAVKAGIWAEASATLRATVGPVVAEVIGKVSAFVGASAEFDGRAFLNWKEGLGAEFAAGARVVAKAEAEAESTISVGGVALQFKGNAVAWAGAEVGAEAKLAVNLTGITVSGKASAFVGAKAEVSGGGSLKLRGRTIVAASGKIGVSVGYGAEVEGSFSFQNGNLKISGALAAALHGGASVGVALELNFGDLAEIIIEEIYAAYNASENDVNNQIGYEREPLTDPTLAKQKFRLGYNAVHADFVNYARGLKARSKPGGVDRGRIQAIIQEHVNRGLAQQVAYLETDEGMKQALLDAFAGLVTDCVIVRGRIAGWSTASATDVAEVKKQFQHDEQVRSASEPLLQAFRDYAAKKSTKGEHGIKQKEVQSIIDKYWKPLKAAYPEPGAADAALTFAAESAFAGYLTAFETTDGQLTKFGAPEAKAQDVKLEAASDSAEQKRQVVYGQLIGSMQKYKQAVIADPTRDVDVAGVQKAFAPAAKKLTSVLGNREINEQVVGVICGALSPLVKDKGVTVDGGKVTEVKADPQGLQTARTERAASAKNAAQQQAINTLRTSLQSYVETKTKRGANGIKREMVQERIDKATAEVRDWVTGGEADYALTIAAHEALQPMLHSIDIVNGEIKTFDAPQATAEQVKKHRSENGKARLGGDEDDNQRRRMVTVAVYPGLSSYAGQIRAAAEKAKPGQAPAIVPTKDRLQGIISAGVKKIRADVVNEVGGAAVTDAVHTVFRMDSTIPLLKDVTIDSNLVVTELVPNDQLADQFAAQRSSAQVGEVVRTVALGLRDDVRQAVTTAQSDGRVPTQSELQTLVTKYYPQLSGLEPEEADEVIHTALITGLGELVRSDRAVVVIDGDIRRCFLIPRHRPVTGLR